MDMTLSLTSACAYVHYIQTYYDTVTPHSRIDKNKIKERKVRRRKKGDIHALQIYVCVRTHSSPVIDLDHAQHSTVQYSRVS